jgi:hypothetical protein
MAVEVSMLFDMAARSPVFQDLTLDYNTYVCYVKSVCCFTEVGCEVVICQDAKCRPSISPDNDFRRGIREIGEPTALP